MFKSKKTTHVASTTYNLAGDRAERPDYKKVTVIGGVLGNEPISQTIANSLINSPYTNSKKFGSWAKKNGYNNLVGLSTGGLTVRENIDRSIVETYLKNKTGKDLTIYTTEYNQNDYRDWAAQYVLKNHPDKALDEWDADLITDIKWVVDPATPYGQGRPEIQGYTISIEFTDGTNTTFIPEGFNETKEYIVTEYSNVTKTVEPVETLEDRFLTKVEFYETLDSEWRLEETANEELLTLHTEVYDDIGGWVITDTQYLTVKVGTDEYVKETVLGDLEEGIKAVRTEWKEQRPQSYTVSKEYITETVRKDVVVLERRLIRTKQEFIEREAEPPQIDMYFEDGSDSSMNSLFSKYLYDYEFNPFIPLREHKQFYKETSQLYKETNKAYRKLYGKNITNITDELKDNDGIDEIDFAYLYQGVPLNAQSKYLKEYVYEFFSQVLSGMNDPYYSFQADVDRYNAEQAAYYEWVWTVRPYDPRNPIPPNRPRYPVTIKPNRVNVTYRGKYNFNNYIEAISIGIVSGTGVKAPLSDPIKIVKETDINQNMEIPSFGVPSIVFGRIFDNNITIYKQVSSNRWEGIELYSLVHRNVVYNGKSVGTGAHAALDDEDDSAFILPLHLGVLKNISPFARAQVVLESNQLVLNSYKVVKKRWYQSGAFAIVISIAVVVVVSFATGGFGAAGLAGSGGILGTNVAVGAAIGLSGTIGIIAGAIGNALAGVIVSMVISKGATALFGAEMGMYIGIIASLATIDIMTAAQTGAPSLFDSLNSLMSAENLLKVIPAIGKGYQGAMGIAAQKYANETMSALDAINKKQEELDKKQAELFGSAGILSTTDIMNLNQIPVESTDTFLSRTTMVGSDIVSTTLNVLYNYTELATNTEQVL